MPNQLQTTQTNAVQTVKSLMNSDVVKNKFLDVLGENAANFIGGAVSLSNSPALIGADPKTFMNAAFIAATLKLQVIPTFGQAYIVPYNNKGKKEAQFQLGYKGLIMLAQNTGLYETINVVDVREGELKGWDMLTGEIKLESLNPDEREKAKIIGYAAYFKLLSGFKKTIYWSREKVEAHAKQYSQSFRNDKYGTSLWNTNFDKMAKKTVLKELLTVYGPKSVEMYRAQKFDQAVVSKDDLIQNENIDIAEVEYVDNQADEPVQAQAPSPSSIADAMAKASAEFKSESKKNDTPTTELF